jgi:limonene-1,2-epoxide hydrolase
MQPREVVLAWIDAFNRADVDTLIALYRADAINQQVAESPVHGREAICAMFETEFATAAMHCIPESLFDDGEWAILEWSDPRGLCGCGFFHVVGGEITFQRSFLRLHGPPMPQT